MGIADRIEARAFYFPQRGPSPRPAGARDVWFPGSLGRRLHGWFVPAGEGSGEPRGLILYCHGNAGNIGSHWGFVEWLAGRGAHLLLFDYAGYGESEPGRIGRDTLQQDVLGALRFATELSEVSGERIVLLGNSLGVAAALSAAAGRPHALRALACICGFRSWRAIACHHAGPLGRLCGPGLDPETQLACLPAGMPLLIAHGQRDRIIPVEHALALHAAAKQARLDVTLHIEPGAHHNDWPTFPGMRDTLARFLKKQLPELFV